MAVGSGKKDTDADDDVDEGKHAQFAAGAAVDVDGEDPNMLRYIEQELAKRRGAGGDDAGMEHPHSRQAAFAASRAALRKEDDGGFQKAEASANLKLQRKEFATSFGKGFASKAKKPRH